MNASNEREVKKLFEGLPFHNVLIEKLCIKHLNNIYVVRQLPFYDELIIGKMLKAFRGYARNYGFEFIDSNYPSV